MGFIAAFALAGSGSPEGYKFCCAFFALGAGVVALRVCRMVLTAWCAYFSGPERVRG